MEVCWLSLVVNDNRLQCKYKYKLAIKEAAAESNRSFNDDLHYKMCTKDDRAFWKSWRKKYCSHSVKCTNVLNGHYGDVHINTFTEYFQSAYTGPIHLMLICIMKGRLTIVLHRKLVTAVAPFPLPLMTFNAVLIR